MRSPQRLERKAGKLFHRPSSLSEGLDKSFMPFRRDGLAGVARCGSATRCLSAAR